MHFYFLVKTSLVCFLLASFVPFVKPFVPLVFIIFFSALSKFKWYYSTVMWHRINAVAYRKLDQPDTAVNIE